MSATTRKTIIFLNLTALATFIVAWGGYGVMAAMEGEKNFLFPFLAVILVATVYVVAFLGTIVLIKRKQLPINPPYALMMANAATTLWAMDDIGLLLKGMSVNNPLGLVAVALVPVAVLNIVALLRLESNRV